VTLRYVPFNTHTHTHTHARLRAQVCKYCNNSKKPAGLSELRRCRMHFPNSDSDCGLCVCFVFGVGCRLFFHLFGVVWPELPEIHSSQQTIIRVWGSTDRIRKIPHSIHPDAGKCLFFLLFRVCERSYGLHSDDGFCDQPLGDHLGRLCV